MFLFKYKHFFGTFSLLIQLICRSSQFTACSDRCIAKKKLILNTFYHYPNKQTIVNHETLKNVVGLNTNPCLASHKYLTSPTIINSNITDQNALIWPSRPN